MAEYYRDEDLKDFASIAKGNPKLYEKFMAWYSEAISSPGALTQQQAEQASCRCDDCGFHASPYWLWIRQL